MKESVTRKVWTKRRRQGLKRLWLFGIASCSLGFALVSTAGATNSGSNPGGPPPIPCCGGGGSVNWGWDELGNLTSAQVSSIEQKLGVPTMVFQYLDNGGQPVLNSSTVSLYHGKHIVIGLIMANDQSYGNGASDANLAASQAENLSAPNNNSVIIYRDIEPHDNPSIAYLNSWVSQIQIDGFVPGFYANTQSGSAFNTNFCASNYNTYTGSALWAGYPQKYTGNYPPYPQTFMKSNAPAWGPYYPPCTIGNTTYAWQYQIVDSSISPVDVDLAGFAGMW